MSDVIAEDSPTHSNGRRRSSYRWIVLALVMSGQIFSFLDRQIVNILMPLIKDEFRLSDTQLGLMSGFAFAIFYAILGIPLARLADRRSRRNLMAVSIAIWSAMATLGGFAQNFIQLVLVRVGVGIGEAGYSPAAYSLISDYFERARRQTALAIVNIGPQIGVMLGLMIGGLIAPTWGWRWALLMAGGPGLLFSIIFFLIVHEPARGMSDGLPPPAVERRPLIAALRALWQVRSYRNLVLGHAFFSFSIHGQVAWLPSLLVREHGMQLQLAGPMLGMALLAGGMGGTLIGGLLGDRLYKIRRDYPVLQIAAAAMVAFPFMISGVLAETAGGALALFAIGYFIASLHIGPAFGLIQSTTPLNLRATGMSMVVLTSALIGLGLGPTTIGVASDLIGGDGSLRIAMALALASLLLPTLFSLFAARSIADELAMIDGDRGRQLS